MRRGASPEQVAAALVPERGSFDDGELAAIAVAKSLARVPCELTVAEKEALVVGVYGHRRAEWIVLAVVMMGFLNKFMDGLGVELEQDVFDEVADTMGAEWSPGAARGDLDAPRRGARPHPPTACARGSGSFRCCPEPSGTTGACNAACPRVPGRPRRTCGSGSATSSRPFSRCARTGLDVPSR